jgi:ribosomal protein S16
MANNSQDQPRVRGGVPTAGQFMAGRKIRQLLSPEETNAEIKKWIDKGFSSRDAKVLVEAGIAEVNMAKWRERGFSATEAATWTNAGFESDQALLWRMRQFKPEEAQQWREICFESEEAQDWKLKGFSASETNEWFYEHSIDSPYVANQWIEKHKSLSRYTNPLDQSPESKAVPEPIKPWLEAGFVFEDAEDWLALGVTPAQAKEWIEVFGPNPADSKEWRSCFSSAIEARQWNMVFDGLKGAYYKKSGFTLAQAIEDEEMKLERHRDR